MCPCEVLGEKDENANMFQLDPAHWEAQNKWNAKIWIAVPGVRKGDNNAPYRVLVIVKQWLLGKSVSPHPLQTRLQTQRIFTVQFMDAFANNKFPGATFRGIVLENPGRPDFTRSLPNERLDIQNEPLYWDLASGHTICKSLLELLGATLDE